MFRKLVSNLPFSPVLVGQLGFYAKRLRREQLTRKLGMVFVVLALIVQSFAVFSPPEPANAASSADFIRGGVNTKSEFLSAYDGNTDLKDIFDYAGITREEITATEEGKINSQGVLSWGRTNQFGTAQGELEHIVPRADGSTTTVFSRPLALWDTTAYTRANGSTYDAFIGHSAERGWFAIIKSCANLVTEDTPEPSPAWMLDVTCDVIRGYAYDGRRVDMPVKVTLYAGGPPGTGENLGTITANNETPEAPAPGGTGHGFEMAVPQEYKQSDEPTPVYGVMTPLPGWPESTIQIGQVEIPPNCEPAPEASCHALSVNRIERTAVTLQAQAQAESGATVQGYTFTVEDVGGGIAHEQSITTDELEETTERIELQPGQYTASVVVHTSEGDKSGGNCTQPLDIAEPEECPLNPELSIDDPACQPCPGDDTIWVNDERCESNITQGKQAANLTQGIDDANGTTANTSDRIEYTIAVENIGLTDATLNVEESLGDVLEYSELFDTGGGTFNDDTQTLVWENVTLSPGERQTRTFVVQVDENIPATAEGTSNPLSYDCRMTNTFGNTINIDVDCPAPKGVEQTVSQLPKTGPGANIAFAGILLAIVAYFYARSRLLGKEVRLIRKEFTAGTV